MKRDGIAFSSSTIALIVVAIAYKAMLLVYAAGMFVLAQNGIINSLGNLRWLFKLGVLLNFGAVAFMMMALFCGDFFRKLMLGILHFIDEKHPLKKYDAYVDKIKTRRECADVAERMIWALEYIELEPDEAPLRGTDIHHEFKDDVLHFFINYDIFLRKVKQEDPMETLHEEHMLRG
jgi:hypothetical protein